MIPKHRAWIKKEKRMVYDIGILPMGGILIPDGETKVGDMGAFEKNYRYYSPESVEISRSTGVPDKEGKEVYEWDALARGQMKWKANPDPNKRGSLVKGNPKISIVKWVAEFSGAIVGFELSRSTNWYADGFLTASKCRKSRIVGNIKENPELI